MRVMNVEACEMEIGIWRVFILHGRRRIFPRGEPHTVIDFTSIRELVGLTKRMHEICQTCCIEMRRVICQQCFHQLPESEIQKEGTTVGPRPCTHLGDFEVAVLAHLSNNLVTRQVLSAASHPQCAISKQGLYLRLYRLLHRKS